MNREDAKIAEAVAAEKAQFAAAIDCVTEPFRRGGRLMYMGAGYKWTSWRTGCQ
jgi:N-acetylmuramic acid 6-phosphate etherase